MTTANELFNNSELAMAAYADLNSLIAENNKNYRDSLKLAGMTEIQAEQFAARYSEVVAVQPETTAGFAATVFREAGTNQRTVAIRGTVPGCGDLNEDAYLTGYGAACKKVKPANLLLAA